MKGVILAGGTGSRLYPLTLITNKHLLPIYDRPMIYYPLQTLKDMGVQEVLLISGKGHAGQFLELLAGGSEFGLKISYEIQEQAGGIAQALQLARSFVGQDPFVVILGDNIFEDSLKEAAQDFLKSSSMAHVFLKEVAQPQHYGVPSFEGDRINAILEKPQNPPSAFAVTGCYFYRPAVFEFLETLKPSARGELEISDVNDHYVREGQLTHSVLQKFWGDCGESIDAMLEVSNVMQAQKK